MIERALQVPGAVLPGTVVRRYDHGVFVDVGGVLGYARGPVAVAAGDRVETAVLRWDARTGLLSIAVTSARPDPWSDALARFPVGIEGKGRVLRVARTEVRVRVETGVEGTIATRAPVRLDRGEVVDYVVRGFEVSGARERRLVLGLVRPAIVPRSGRAGSTQTSLDSPFGRG